MANVEINGDGRQANKPGLYRDPETGAEVVVAQHPKIGSAMADGIAQVGFKHVGPAPKKQTAKK